MPSTKNKPSAKQLRLEAQAAGINGWEEMGRDALAVALAEANEAADSKPAKKSKKAPKSKAVSKPAKATKSKKAVVEDAPKKTAKAKVAKAIPPVDGERIFRKGSNLDIISKLLLRGGNRRAMAEKLAQKVAIRPYTRDEGTIEIGDYDKRIVLAADLMQRKLGFEVVKEGRGMDGTIKVVRPGEGSTTVKTPKASKKTAKATTKGKKGRKVA